jgi:predicted nucleic acid-binding protein
VLIIDTGVLVAAADDADADHQTCAELLEDEPGPLVTTPLVIAETAYLIGRQLGPDAEARFFRAIANGEIRVDELTDEELDRVADLIERYRDLPLGGTDASLVVLAERHGEARIGTLDHRHFRVVRPTHVAAFELVP